MDFVVLALFAVAAVLYIWTVRTIWQLVNESKRIDSGVRFNLWRWTPAWKVHRTAYPESALRKQIVTRGLLTCGFGLLAFACKVYAVIQSLVWPGR
jgi:hypothetical protein